MMGFGVCCVPTLSIALSDVRDLVLVVSGVIYILLAIVLLAVAALSFWFGRKGMSAVHRLVNVNLVAQIRRVPKLADSLEGRTAKLPGAPGSEAGAGDLIAAAQNLREMDPPFRRKVKSWRPF